MAIDADAIARRVQEEVARRLLVAALALQAAYRGDVSVGNPAPHDHPAPRGEYPRLRTGQGRAAVTVTPASIAEAVAAGQVTVGHAGGGHHLYFLAGRGWKGLLDTYARERAKIVVILQGS